MAAPTFVADYAPADAGDFGDAVTPKSVSVTTAVGDVLAILAASEDVSTTLNLPTGGTGTYVNQENVTGDNSGVRIDTAVTGITAQTFTLEQTRGATSGLWGFDAFRFSGSAGIGAAESGSADDATATISITTTQANSAIAVIIGDWEANDGATRTWATVNSITPTAGNGYERIYFRDGAHYTVYVAYYPDAGAIGAKTVGITSPTGQDYSIAAVEIKGSTGTVNVTALSAVAVGLAVPPGLEVAGGWITGRAISYEFADHQVVIESGR